MDIHHNTSFRSSILEDDSISSTSKAHICICSGKRSALWLIIKPSIYSFCITHFIFTSMLHFRFNLTQLLASSLFTCKCGHRLDTFGMHLVHCLFGGQQTITHDAIWDVMCALAWRSGHVVWKSGGTPLHQEFHYNPISTWPKRTRSSLPMWWLLTQHKIQWLRVSLVNQHVQLRNLAPLLRFTNIKGFMRGTTLFRWPWRCTTHLGVT
jgi:hypothetical protein